MHTQDTRTRQLQETLEVAAALKNRSITTPGSTPSAGEMYLCQRTAEFPVEWLVLEGGDLLHLVPVDDYPLTGSHDVELTSLATGSAAVARCHINALADASRFEPELRTRVLTEAELERVQAKRVAISSDNVTPSLLEDVADGDLDYQRWIDGTLRPAVAALEKVPEAVPILPFRIATKARTHWPVAVAMAATLAVVVGMGTFAIQLGHQLSEAHERIVTLEQVDHEKAEQLEKQATRIQDQVRIQQTLERESRESKSLFLRATETLHSVQDQLTKTQQALTQLRDVGAVVNVRKLLFGSKQRFDRGGTRGEDVIISAGSGQSLLFEIEILDPEPYSTYRLRFEPTKFGKALVIEGLDRDGASLRFSLSSDALEVGEYDLLIEGSGFGDPKELDERYSLTVTP